MPKSTFWFSIVPLFVLLAATGCVSTRHEVHSTVLAPNQQGVLFAVNGAGGWHGMSNAFQKAVQDARLPLGVEVFEWTHGSGRFLADQIDCAHARVEGLQLAGQIVSYRRHYPGGEVYLVGHSAGCAVVVAAVEALPPEMVDRAILLAPSLSADYDLRPALRGCRDGIDVFSSPRDVGYLAVGVGLIGTSDRRWQAAAGRVGFRPHAETPADLALFAKLRQHPWDPCLEWSDNRGGHFGAYQPVYLRAFLLPLLTSSNRRGPL